MSDRLALSCWLRNFHPLTMASQWNKLLGLFPHSVLSRRPNVLRVHAVSLAEPLLVENALAIPFVPEDAVHLAREFAAGDVAWELECYWDLLQANEAGDWILEPAAVSLWCFAPEFENEFGDHMRIEFGMEETFLPEDGDERSLRAVQANLQSVLRLVQQVGDTLPVERKHLWSESGANFAERLRLAVADPAPGLGLQ